MIESAVELRLGERHAGKAQNLVGFAKFFDFALKGFDCAVKHFLVALAKLCVYFLIHGPEFHDRIALIVSAQGSTG